MTNTDIANYMDACKEYTDFSKEGKDLMVEFKKTKFISKTLLDALNFNPPKAFNLRSQEAPRSWLGNEQFGLHAVEREKMSRKYLANINRGAKLSEADLENKAKIRNYGKKF
jgi:hypothetical protein